MGLNEDLDVFLLREDYKLLKPLGMGDVMALDNITDETNPKDKIGAKKPRLSLVPPSGLVYAALAMANGADKYGPYNWRDKKVQAMIYLEACVRHILSWQDGEENAQDSGVPHLGHAIACLL